MPESRLTSIVPTVAAVVGVLLTAYLGNWQLDRAAYKRELQDRYEHAAHQPAVRIPAQPGRLDMLDYQHVEAVGTFRPEMTVLLDNRVREGMIGYEVVTPLQLKDADRHVLVKRGWVKGSIDRSRLPAISTPPGIVTVEGIALPPPTHFFELSKQPEAGNVWQNLKFDRYAETYGIAIQPILLQETNDLGDGLSRDWPPPATGIDRHQGYALQWFAMSACIIVIYVALHVRKKKRAL